MGNYKGLHMKYYTYLSGPMESCSQDEQSAWRTYVKERLDDCIDPVDSELTKNTPRQIVEQDLSDIDKSTFVLVSCVDTKPETAGTYMEIMYAHTHGRYVIVVADSVRKLNPWVRHYSHKRFNRRGMSGYAKAIEHINKLKAEYDK